MVLQGGSLLSRGRPPTTRRGPWGRQQLAKNLVKPMENQRFALDSKVSDMVFGDSSRRIGDAGHFAAPGRHPPPNTNTYSTAGPQLGVALNSLRPHANLQYNGPSKSPLAD